MTLADIQNLLVSEKCWNATDIFLSAGKQPSYRINGKIEIDFSVEPVPAQVIDELRNTLLQLQNDPEKNEHYRQCGDCDTALQFDSYRFRVNFYESVYGPSAVFRPIKNAEMLNMKQMNMPEELLMEYAAMPRGLILITGATGSGKSTTMAALIQTINKTRPCHILTLEDPIEYLYNDDRAVISQREIKSNGFASALRAALRENPDVIVVGEMRDPETASAAISAALTGHLVISTLHTSDSISTVERIINMFPEEQQQHIAESLSISLNGILSQILLPHANEKSVIPVFESLVATPSVKKLIRELDYNGLHEHLRRDEKSGSISLLRALFQMTKKHLITKETALNATPDSGELAALFKGIERGEDTFRNETGSGQSGIIGDMTSLLTQVVLNGASDMILSVGAAPMMRIDGKLVPITNIVLTDTDIQKLLFSILDRRRRVELEEKRELDLALSIALRVSPQEPEKNCRFRFNAFFQRGSIGVVARVINAEIPLPSALMLPPALIGLTRKKQGLILVTGPTGSGKSTTLASLIQLINMRDNSHIITIEDPIEYVYKNEQSVIEQRELHSDTLSFVDGLKYALRQDPDVILIGEMRDLETISAALTAAETGHLVFATLHTNSAPQTIDRIVDSYPENQQNQIRLQLAAVLLGVVSQRLCPRKDGNGRIAVFEVMTGTSGVRSLIREGKTHQLPTVLDTSRKDGMIQMNRALELLVEQGLIDHEEIYKMSQDYRQ